MTTATKPRKTTAAFKRQAFEEDQIFFAQEGNKIRGSADALIDISQSILPFTDVQEAETRKMREAYQAAADILIKAADEFEKNIPKSILEKRDDSFFSMVDISKENMSILMAFSCLNSGELRWQNGEARIRNTSYLMLSELLGRTFQATRGVFHLAEESASKADLAAKILAVK